MEEGLARAGSGRRECIICLEALGSIRGGGGGAQGSGGPSADGDPKPDSIVVLGCCSAQVHLGCLLKWLHSGGPGGCPHCRSTIPAVATAAATGYALDPSPSGSDEQREHMRAVLAALSSIARSRSQEGSGRQEQLRRQGVRGQAAARSQTVPVARVATPGRRNCSGGAERIFVAVMVLAVIGFGFHIIW